MLDRNVFMSRLFEHEYPRLFRIAYRQTGSQQMAEDLIQETFLLALVRYKELAEHPALGAWLAKTVHNLAQNERRRAGRHLEIPLEEAVGLPADKPIRLEDFLPVQLPEEDQALLIWRFGQQRSCREIASQLGISEGACRMRISRALKKCRELLEPQGP